MNIRTLAAVAALGSVAALSAQAQSNTATFAVRSMTPEIAMKAVTTAMQVCRQRGFQVAVAVVDRSGNVQALVRDRFAGPHTPDTATNKAWTAVSFRTNTLELASLTESGQVNSGIRHLPRFVGVGGGVMIEAGGQLLGAIGVSGAPGGDADAECAKAGIAAVQADLDL